MLWGGLMGEGMIQNWTNSWVIFSFWENEGFSNSILVELNHIILPMRSLELGFDPYVPVHISGRGWKAIGIINNNSIPESTCNVCQRASAIYEKKEVLST